MTDNSTSTLEKDIDSITRTRIAECAERTAKALNLLESVHDELEFVFEQNPDWNPDIQWQIREAAAKLGFSLATLCRWYDDDEEETEK